MPVNSFKPFRVEQVRETSLITRRVVVVSRRDVLNAPTTYHTDHDTESTLDQLTNYYQQIKKFTIFFLNIQNIIRTKID